MNKKKNIVSKEKTQNLSVRVPYSVYDTYEQYCVAEQITMSSILRKAVLEYVRNNNFDKSAQG